MIDLSHEKFEAQQELAKVHGEISTAKAVLIDVKENIDKFLAIRKVKEQEMLNILYEESKELVDSIQNDFSKISSYYKEVKSYTGFLFEMQKSIKEILNEYVKDADDFIMWAKKEEQRLADIRKGHEETAKSLEGELEKIEKQKQDIEKSKKHIESQSKTLEASHKELKKLWDKTLNKN